MSSTGKRRGRMLQNVAISALRVKQGNLQPCVLLSSPSEQQRQSPYSMSSVKADLLIHNQYYYTPADTSLLSKPSSTPSSLSLSSSSFSSRKHPYSRPEADTSIRQPSFRGPTRSILRTPSRNNSPSQTTSQSTPRKRKSVKWWDESVVTLEHITPRVPSSAPSGRVATTSGGSKHANAENNRLLSERRSIQHTHQKSVNAQVESSKDVNLALNSHRCTSVDAQPLSRDSILSPTQGNRPPPKRGACVPTPMKGARLQRWHDRPSNAKSPMVTYSKADLRSKTSIEPTFDAEPIAKDLSKHNLQTNPSMPYDTPRRDSETSNIDKSNNRVHVNGCSDFIEKEDSSIRKTNDKNEDDRDEDDDDDDFGLVIESNNDNVPDLRLGFLGAKQVSSGVSSPRIAIQSSASKAKIVHKSAVPSSLILLTKSHFRGQANSAGIACSSSHKIPVSAGRPMHSVSPTLFLDGVATLSLGVGQALVIPSKARKARRRLDIIENAPKDATEVQTCLDSLIGLVAANNSGKNGASSKSKQKAIPGTEAHASLEAMSLSVKAPSHSATVAAPAIPKRQNNYSKRKSDPKATAVKRKRGEGPCAPSTSTVLPTRRRSSRSTRGVSPLDKWRFLGTMPTR